MGHQLTGGRYGAYSSTHGRPATSSEHRRSSRQGLAEAGIRSLDDAERIGLDHLAALHGVGPKAIRILRAALEQ